MAKETEIFPEQIEWKFYHGSGSNRQIEFFKCRNDINLAWKVAKHLCLIKGWRNPANITPKIACDESILKQAAPSNADGLILPSHAPEEVTA